MSNVDAGQRSENPAPTVWWARFLSRPYQFLLDIGVLAVAFFASYLLRFELDVPPNFQRYALVQLPFVLLVQFGALFAAGVYAFVWRYVGLRELRAFLRAAAWSLFPLLAVRVAGGESHLAWRIPLSIIVLDTVLGMGAVLALRVLRRAMYERFERHRGLHGNDDVGPQKVVLLVGAGRAGVMAARELQGRGDAGLEIGGFVDDDPNKLGLLIHGIKVLGSTRDLPRLVRTLGVDHVIITIASAAREDIRRIARVCEEIPVRMRIIPGFFELLQGKVAVSRLRDVQIEDLLGRSPVELDTSVVGPFLEGRGVMVTGAGGSIGAELARQAARFAPSRLVLIERAEGALFEIHRELLARFPGVDLLPLVADVVDEPRMRQIFAAERPSVVMHAAAHKHVPLMEQNPAEAIKNNVFGTRGLGALAGEFGVDVMVLISTDKAVRPTSVMGASKRVAELALQELGARYKTRYVAVRFGNVLGSTGSVIPIFREQIANGGPITVTHPEMVRYFMTIPEAAQLVLQAGAMGRGGEIFILDMGAPVRIVDLAEDMIRLSGLRPFEDIEIRFTGTRPGEKLFEELAVDAEHLTRTRHPKIFIGHIQPAERDQVAAALHRLEHLAHDGDATRLRRYLAELLPEARLAGTEGAREAPHAPARVMPLPARASV